MPDKKRSILEISISLVNPDKFKEKDEVCDETESPQINAKD